MELPSTTRTNTVSFWNSLAQWTQCLSGAGENKRTLTDIVHHEIAYSERQALAVPSKMCQQGIISIIPVRNDYIVVIARANSDDLASIKLQFGKALNSDDVLEMLNDEIFGADISGLLQQQAQHTLRAAQRKILPPFLLQIGSRRTMSIP